MTPAVATQFQEIAAAIEEGRNASSLPELFERTHALCRQAAEHAKDAAQRKALTDVQLALATWKDVWPRLGGQRDFRLAVAREAKLWSKRLEQPHAAA